VEGADGLGVSATASPSSSVVSISPSAWVGGGGSWVAVSSLAEVRPGGSGRAGGVGWLGDRPYSWRSAQERRNSSGRRDASYLLSGRWGWGNCVPFSDHEGGRWETLGRRISNGCRMPVSLPIAAAGCLVGGVSCIYFPLAREEEDVGTHCRAILRSRSNYHRGGLLEGPGFRVGVKETGGGDFYPFDIEDGRFEVYEDALIVLRDVVEGEAMDGK